MDEVTYPLRRRSTDSDEGTAKLPAHEQPSGRVRGTRNALTGGGQMELQSERPGVLPTKQKGERTYEETEHELTDQEFIDTLIGLRSAVWVLGTGAAFISPPLRPILGGRPADLLFPMAPRKAGNGPGAQETTAGFELDSP